MSNWSHIAARYYSSELLILLSPFQKKRAPPQIKKIRSFYWKTFTQSAQELLCIQLSIMNTTVVFTWLFDCIFSYGFSLLLMNKISLFHRIYYVGLSILFCLYKYESMNDIKVGIFLFFFIY